MASTEFKQYYASDDDKLLSSIHDDRGYGIKKIGRLLKDRVVDGKAHAEGEKVIIQEIEKRNLTQSQSKALRLSFSTLQKLKDHANVLHLIEVFEDDHHLIIIKEFFEGVNFIDAMTQGGPFTEAEVVHIVTSIMDVIDKMNKEGLSHRGLNTEGILYLDDKENGTSTIKIEDFQASGPISAFVDVGCFLLTANAPPHCIAPEVLSAEGPFTEKVDWWSIGVLTYTLLYGNYPFDDANDAVVIQNILTANYSFPEDIKISDAAKDFISKLLVVDVKSRASGAECWSHPWVSTQVQG